MKFEGTCPTSDCGAQLGMDLGGLGAYAGLMPDDFIEDLINDDDTEVYCPSCENWVNPQDVTMED